MPVSIHLWNSISDDYRTIGPFDFVQFTYTLIRVENDQELGSLTPDGCWRLYDSPVEYTDVAVIAANSQ